MELAVQNHGTSTDPTYDEWARLICKLRWIGLEDEAERLRRAVRSLSPDERPVLIHPSSTD